MDPIQFQALSKLIKELTKEEKKRNDYLRDILLCLIITAPIAVGLLLFISIKIG